MRSLLAAFLSAILAVPPAFGSVVVRPGPVFAPAAVPAGAPPASAAEAWSRNFSDFLGSSTPDLASVGAAASALAGFDAGNPGARAALRPLARVLEAALPAVLAAPPESARRKDLEAVQLKLKVLNFPAVRALLPEASRDAVGRAAWAYNDALWGMKRRSLKTKIRAIAKRLAEGSKPATGEPVPTPVPGAPAVEVSVVAGEITEIEADALVATVDEAGVCRGGLHTAIAKAGGACYRSSVSAKLPLKDGETLLARPKRAAKTAFKGVLYLSDLRERPLEDVVFDGLRAADAAGLESLSLPALRMGSVFGAVEKSAAEVLAGIKRGIERFAAAGAKSLRRIALVVKNDSDLAAKVQRALAGSSRERSLRTDLRPAELSGKGYEPSPRPTVISDRSSPIYASLLKPWDLSHLLQVHKPVPIGGISDRAAFSGPTPSVLNMPIKMPGTGYRVPEELAGFKEFLQKVIDHETAVNPEAGDFYAYLTVDQGEVAAGSTHRRPGIHIDGVQGARYPVKLPPEHLYSASDALGTVFYDQSFDLTRLDPAKHHVHAELERQAREESAVRVPDYQIAFWDSYSVHRADTAPEPLKRTFVRVEFSRKKYDSLGDTRNPLFDYDWKPVARPIPAGLDDRPLPAQAERGYAAGLEGIEPGAPHTVKKLRRYLADNLGEKTLRAARRGQAPFLIVAGDGASALAEAGALGWTVGARVEKAEGFHRVHEARDPAGRKGFVISRVNGSDRVVHIQSFLKLAGAPAERVFTAGTSVSLRAHYRRVFARAGPPPDLVVYGFANTAIDAALLRNAFKNGRHFKSLRRNFRSKREAIAGRAGNAHDLDGMSLQILELADGRTVWFLHCMFGDLVKDLLGAAADHGAKNILFLGSAGSLEASGRMGELVVPAAMRRSDGSVAPLDRLGDIPGLPRRGVYERIRTPNLGTRKWTAAARARGTDFIESEFGHALDELAGRPGLRFWAALVIAEAVFGPDGRDMTEWGYADLRGLMPRLNAALDAALDAALGAGTPDWVVKSYRSVSLGR